MSMFSSLLISFAIGLGAAATLLGVPLNAVAG